MPDPFVPPRSLTFDPRSPFLGAGYLICGLRLLRVPGIKRFVLVPLAINLVVFVLLLWLAFERLGGTLDRLAPQLPAWLAALTWLIWIVFGVAAVAFVFFTFTLAANLIAAPFNGLLAEAVERHLTGQPPGSGGGLRQALHSAPAQVVEEIRKLAYYVRWAVPLLLLFLVPGVNLVAPFLWMLFGAWMLSVQYADYPLGNHGVRSTEQRRMLRKSWPVVMGFGGATMLATMAPVLNLLIVPAAVAGATAMVVEHLGSGGRP